MFDFHAHYGSDNSEAFVSLLRSEEIEKIKDVPFPSIGLLPWIEELDIIQLASVLEDNPGCHVGEIGMDKRFGEMEIQERIFRRMLAIARDLDRIAIIHSVSCTEECFNILKEMKVKKAIFHSFGSSYEVGRKIVDAGYDISLSRRIFHRRDYDRIISLPYLLETDLETGERQRSEISELYYNLATGYQAERKKEIWKGSF